MKTIEELNELSVYKNKYLAVYHVRGNYSSQPPIREFTAKNEKEAAEKASTLFDYSPDNNATITIYWAVDDTEYQVLREVPFQVKFHDKYNSNKKSK